jgi:hypothetical protein
MKLVRVLHAGLTPGLCLCLSGCFTALTRYGGNDPSPTVTVGAATADIVTSPVQVPLFAASFLGDAASRPSKEQIEQAAARRAALKAEEQRVFALAQQIHERIEAAPELLTSDEFWEEYAGETRAQSIALGRSLGKQTLPVAAEVTEFLLHRFPANVHSILNGGRVPQVELTAMVTNPARCYSVRSVAISALVRDRSFDFGEPWRTILINEFPQHLGLLFGTERYTRAELIQLSRDPAQHPSVRWRAEERLRYNRFKPEPVAGGDS